jgi:hypothetical protein
MIDPLETVITWLETALPSVSGRVANKQRFPTDWTPGLKCVSVHPDNLGSDLYASLHTSRLEIRLYGSSTSDIIGLWMELVALGRTVPRVKVATTLGNGLLNSFIPTSGLSIVWNEDLKMDTGVVFIDCLIAEGAAL